MAPRASEERDRSFGARFGRTILQRGIAAIPAALYRYQARLNLTPAQAWFVSAILARMWDADLPHPSLKHMAVEAGVSLRYLQGLRQELEKRGLLIVYERTTVVGGQATNGYDFGGLFALIEEAINAEIRQQQARSQWLDNPPELAPYPFEEGGANHSSFSGVNHSSMGGLNHGSLSGLNHGSLQLTETDKEESLLTESPPPSIPPEGGKRKKKGPKEPDRPDVVELCESMISTLTAREVRRVPDKPTDPWKQAARLLLDTDRRPLAEAREVLAWAMADDFWQDVILSMPKFRIKYDQLRGRWEKSQARSTNGHGPTNGLARPSPSASDAANAEALAEIRRNEVVVKPQ